MRLTQRQAGAVVTVIALAAPGVAAASPAAAAPGAGLGAARHAATFAGRPGAAPGTISTIAGGTGGPGRAARIPLGAGYNRTCGVSFRSGFMYVGDLATVRKVTLRTGWLTTPVGAGAAFLSALGDGGPAADAAGSMCNLTFDHSGNMLLAGNDQVRAVAAHTGTFYGQAMTAGDIYTIAGNGQQGFAGDGGPATGAEFSDPTDVAVDQAGNLAITDVQNLRVRMLAARTGTFYGQAMTAGDIYTIAGDGTAGFSGDGGPATKAAILLADGVAEDAAGNLVLTDGGNNRIRVIAAQTGTFYGQAMTAGDIYTIAGDGTAGFTGDGGPATSAEIRDPEGVTRDAAGNLLFTDTGNNRVRVIAAHTGTFYGQAMTAGDIYTVAGNGRSGLAGDGGPATQADVNLPGSVAVDSAGNLLIADKSDERVRVVAATNGTFYGKSMTAGDIYTVAGNATGGEGASGPALKAQFLLPQATAVDAAGNLVIADPGTERVRVLAASNGMFYGQAMTAGNIYTIAGNGKYGVSGDGGPATKATLYNPVGVALDAAGNVLIANNARPKVRVVAEKTGTFYGQAMTAGDIYTIAGSGKVGIAGDGGPALDAKFVTMSGVAVDGAGNVLLTDLYRVRVVPVRTGTFYGQAMTAGDIYTIAGLSIDHAGGFSGDGGPATKARLQFPGGLTVDGAGNLVIADAGNSRIRVVAARTGTFYGQAMTAGDIYTVAGNGTQGFAGDGGPATAAELNQPQDVTLDGSANLVIADTFNNAIRVVAASTGTFYGQAMTAGHIYTVAGTASPGFSGDGGPATGAQLYQPWGVTADGPGNLVIADTNNVRIRLVTG